MKNFVRPIVDLVIPPKCVVCGGTLLRDEKHICLSCLADMPLTYFWVTGRNKMADGFNALIEKRLPLEAPYQEYSAAMALFFYNDEYEHLTKAVKYGGDAPLGVWLGAQLGTKLLEAGISGTSPTAPSGKNLPPVSAVVPVPLHWKRRWKRGYNQAELIARGVVQTIGAPLVTDLLLKSHSTGSQTSLTQEERLANVASAFSVNPKALAGLLSGSIGQDSTSKAPHILLIDDVYTTGSTLFTCHQALTAAVEKLYPTNSLATSSVRPHLRISVATLAYVP